MTKQQKQEQTEAREHLRQEVKPGDVLHTVVRTVARSGMSRTIDVYRLHEGSTDYLSGWVAKALDYRQNDHGALKVTGCGMDMGFAVVYQLGAVLFRDGFGCTGDQCPSNGHSNGDRDYTRHGAKVKSDYPSRDTGARSGLAVHWHTSGGYALRQAWI